MPNLPISLLPAASPLVGDELFVTVQDGVTKYTTGNGIKYVPGSNYGLYSQTGSSVPITGITGISTPTSGSLLDGGTGTLTVPANGFQKGDTFHAKLAGKVNMANGHTLDIQFKADGSTLVDTGEISMPKTTDNRNWHLDINFIIRNTGTAGTASILSSGMFTVRKDAAGEVVSELFSFQNNTTFDTTISNTISIIGIMGPACTDTENIYSELFILNKVF